MITRTSSVRLVAFALGLLAAGCGGTASPPVDAGTDATTTDAATTDAIVPSDTRGADTGGADAGRGISFATAIPITVGASATSGEIADPAMSRDFYSFTGAAGEAVVIHAAAQTGTDPFDPTITDLVVTLFDASDAMIAQNDDPWPLVSLDPTLFTILPAAGTYYVVVSDCNAAATGAACTSPSQITQGAYSLTIDDVGGAGTTAEGVEPGNDTTTGAATIAYAIPAGHTTYAPTVLHGHFDSATDADFFQFTVPADANIPAGARARADFWITPSGSDGNGSTASVGRTTVSASDGTTVLAQLDATQYAHPPTSTLADLSVPVVAGQSYYLSIASGASAAGAHDFYFVQALAGSLTPSAPATEHESSSGMNDTSVTSETASARSNADGTSTFAVDGDLSPVSDVDWYRLTLPSGVTQIRGACVAARGGSGLLGLRYAVLASDGTTSIATQLESATSDVSIAPTDLPTGATSLYLRVDASGQSATIVGTSYVCTLVVSP